MTGLVVTFLHQSASASTPAATSSVGAPATFDKYTFDKYKYTFDKYKYTSDKYKYTFDEYKYTLKNCKHKTTATSSIGAQDW